MYLAMGLSVVAAGFLAKQKLNQSTATPETMDVEITWASALNEGEIKPIQIGEKEDNKVLIARYEGKLYATGNKCSHFGVPLEYGMLFDNKVICPAHAAGFNITTGEPEQAPGLDGIPTFPVIEKDGKFFVQVPASGELPFSVAMPMAKRDMNDKRHFVVLGGGAAGLNCAETLRQSGFTGQITVVSKEDMVAYDRTLITKALASGDATKWALRPEQYLKDHDMDFELKSRAFSVNLKEKKVILVNGKHLHYDKLCVATGADAFKPPIPGLDKTKNVFTVRTNKDQLAIKEAAAKAKNIVVLGASFIGSEATASLAGEYAKTKSVSMICSDDVPFKLQLGPEIGAYMLKEHQDNGVKVHTNVMVKKINADASGNVASVTLSNGETLEADLLIVGAGVRPATEFLKDSGLNMDKQGGIVCDPFLNTSNKDVFAAGDICSYPYWPTGGHTRTEHWVVALDQGTFAAFNMLGKYVPYNSIPFFWTRHYNKSIHYVGNGSNGYKEIHIDGEVMSGKFIAYYINDKDKIVAVASQNNNGASLSFFEAMAQNKMPSGSDIKSGKVTPAMVTAEVK